MHSEVKSPLISDNPLYQLLRDQNTRAFNAQRELTCDFSGLDFRGIDLRGINTENINFANCYFHGSDLRGLDLQTCNLSGASLHRAHIAGTYFPPELDAAEIRLSLKEGTRMRYNNG